MSKSTRSLVLLAATLIAGVALSSTARAQIETFDTITSYNGTGETGFTGGDTALTQTFTDVLQVTDMTYAFVQTGSFGAQSVTAYFVSWNTTTNSPNSTTPLWSETFTVPASTSGAWTSGTFSSGGTYTGYDAYLDVDSAVLDPSQTYAMILIDNTDQSGLALMDVATGNNPVTSPTNVFPYGESYVDYSPASTLSAMGPYSSNPAYGPYGDWGFAQIDVVPAGNVIPVPEARTAAVALCGLFVAFLVGRRLLRQGQDEVLPGAALA